MQLFTACMKCQSENGVPNLATFGIAPIPDDGVVRLQCEAGHDTHMILQQDRFELLSELAVTALADGYFREAVASFQASLERLYEFFLRASWRFSGIGNDAIAATWKEISNSSERQLGAFMAEYLRQTGEPAPILSTNTVKFRNSVIHKGRFPTKEEAITFGEAVSAVVMPIMKELKSGKYSDAIQTLLHERLVSAYQAAQNVGAQPSTASHGTLFSMVAASDEIDVRRSVEERAKRPSPREAVRAALEELRRQSSAD